MPRRKVTSKAKRKPTKRCTGKRTRRTTRGRYDSMKNICDYYEKARNERPAVPPDAGISREEAVNVLEELKGRYQKRKTQRHIAYKFEQWDDYWARDIAMERLDNRIYELTLAINDETEPFNAFKYNMRLADE